MNTQNSTQKQTKASYADAVKNSSGPSSSAQSTEEVVSQTHSIPAQSHSRDYRQAVREELLELEERRKRKASLVIRGLGASSALEAVRLFGDVTQFLIGERVELSEACRIRNDTDLIRGNVHDVRLRRLILDQARELKNSRLSHIFIRRDLTYQQREELKARRLANTSQGQTQGERPIRSSHGDRAQNVEQRPQQNTHPYEETVPKQVWNPRADRDREVIQHSESGNRQPNGGTLRTRETSPAAGTDTQRNGVQHDPILVNLSTHQSEEPRERPGSRDEHQGGPARDHPNLSSDQSGN